MEFGMPEPGPIDFIDTTYDPFEESEIANQLIRTLNPLQLTIFDEICSVIDDNTVESKFFFLDGPGGTGKTYLYNTIMNHLRGHYNESFTGREQKCLGISHIGNQTPFLYISPEW